ncbi:MAG TPA: hypothetical protein VFA77_06010 [Candidatus Eisenbacteria bacterium]|nr:hypothetical protein [Candidatus Eisenbacteria bacterium]
MDWTKELAVSVPLGQQQTARGQPTGARERRYSLVNVSVQTSAIGLARVTDTQAERADIEAPGMV